MRRLFYLLPLLLLATARPASAQLANAQGWCEAGAQNVITSGLTSTTQVQESVPFCTVSVSIHGGGTATIFSTGSSTPLSNPFQATSGGRWIFYAANGEYDITLTCTNTCVPPSPNPFPVTYSDVFITNVTSGGGGGGTPASPFNSFQYNNAGSFGGAAGVTTPDAGNSIDIRGPIPWFDLMQYGGYTSGTTPTATTAACNGTSTITVASAIDFAVGQGIRIAQCGAATILATPPTPTVTPFNITGGATTYSYQVAAEGLGGDITAASTAGSTAAGQANLGVTNLALASVSRASGVTTYTLQAGITSLTSGQTVNVTTFTNTSFNGVLTIASVPLSTTFTVLQPGLADASETNSSGVAQVLACNRLTLASNSVSATIDTGGGGANVLRYWYWRNKSGGAFALVGNATGADPYYEDCGQDVDTAHTPDYVPSTPPSSAQPGYLATTITNIAGTTFTLAAAATQTISGQNALHDNGPNIIKMAKAVGTNAVGGIMYLPSAILTGGYYVINSLVDLRSSNVNYGSGTPGMVIQGWLFVNQPILPPSGGYFEGLPAINGFAFNYGPKTFVAGNASPIFFIKSGSNITFKNLKISATGNQTIGVFSDSAANGSGATGITFDGVGVGYGGQNYGSPITLKGGVDFIFKNDTTCSGHTSFTWNGSPGCLRFTNSSTALTTGNAQVPGRVQIDNLYCGILCVQIDTDPSLFGGSNGPTSTMGSYNFKGGIFENAQGPFVRIRVTGSAWSDFTFNDMQTADESVGPATPVVDAEGNSSLNSPVTFINIGTGAVPDFVGTSANTTNVLFLNNGAAFNPGNPASYVAFTPTSGTAGGTLGSPTGLLGSYEYLSGGMAIASGTTGKLGYAIAAPTGTTASASAGGSWPTGTWAFAWSAVDWNGYETPLSSPFLLLVSGGSQTIASSCTASTSPAASIRGYKLYYSNGGGYANQLGPIAACSTTGQTSQAGNPSFGGSAANATSTSIDSNGLNTYKIKCGEGTAPSGQTGVDIIYCDSTTHKPEFINNNGSAIIPSGVSAALTSGNIPKMASNGIDLVDSTFAPAAFVQIICTGQISLTTGAISSGTRATNTLSCTGLSASTDSISCTFSGDTNAVTGYAPSASGGISLKTWASTNTINVDQVNNTSGSITPGAATVNCKGMR